MAPLTVFLWAMFICGIVLFVLACITVQPTLAMLGIVGALLAWVAACLATDKAKALRSAARK